MNIFPIQSFIEYTKSVRRCQKISVKIRIVRYLIYYLPILHIQKEISSRSLHTLLVSLKQLQSRAAVTWVSMILDKGATALKLVTEKKERVMCPGQQLCRGWRIRRKHKVVPLLSQGCPQKAGTPSACVC